MASMKKKMAEGGYKSYTKKERLLLEREIARLERFFGGIAEIESIPDLFGQGWSSPDTGKIGAGQRARSHLSAVTGVPRLVYRGHGSVLGHERRLLHGSQGLLREGRRQGDRCFPRRRRYASRRCQISQMVAMLFSLTILLKVMRPII